MQLEVKKISTLGGHSGAIYALEQAEATELFYSGSSDKFVTKWNLNTIVNEKFAAAFPAIVYAICYVNERSILLVGTSAGSIHIIDLAKKEEIKILQLHTGGVFDIKYNLQTNCFYTAGGDGNFAVSSLETFSLIQLKKICVQKIRSISISALTSEIAIASGDGNIRVFDLITLSKKVIVEAHQFSANCVCYSPNGKFLLSGGKDAHLKQWNTTNYTLQKSIPAHNYAIYHIVFSPDSTLFATASRDKTIKIWNAASTDLLLRINKENYDGHINSVNKLLWTNYNNQLVSTGDDRAIMIWKINKLS